jgi:predicted ATPase
VRDAQAPRDQGFKSLEQIDDLEFPRLAVFAGPNAAGKSNLLDAIQMVARAGTQRTLAEALSKPIRGLPAEAFTLPSGGLAELMDRKLARFELWASLELPSNGRGPERVRYAVRIETEPRGGTLSVDEESLTALSADWLPKGLPRIETANDALLLRRQGQSQPRHEPLHANHTLLSDSRLSGSLYPLFDRVRQELRTWRTYYLDPQDAMREAVGPREVEDIGSRGEHIAPFLYGLKLRQPKAFAAVERSLRAIIPAISGLDVDLDPKRGALDIQIGQDGTLFSSRVVSEGTLRVLALCAIAVTATHGLVAIEEPENGVQPQRLDRIAELLSSTVRRGSAQFVLTTHSPGFVAAMLHRSREASESIGLFGVSRSGRATDIRRIRLDESLFTDAAINELLQEPDERDKITALVQRDWLDL